MYASVQLQQQQQSLILSVTLCVENSQLLPFRLISILRRNAANILGITRAGDRPGRRRSPLVEYV